MSKKRSFAKLIKVFALIWPLIRRRILSRAVAAAVVVVFDKVLSVVVLLGAKFQFHLMKWIFCVSAP